MKLVSLPDCKKIHHDLTIGKEYDFELWGQNGAIITTDSGERIIILKERLQ